jgi:hypothetical protein
MDWTQRLSGSEPGSSQKDSAISSAQAEERVTQ